MPPSPEAALITGDSPARAPLDLSLEAVQRHWHRHGVEDAVAAMEETETWTVASTLAVEATIKALSERLSDTPQVALTRSITATSADVVDFMGYLKSGRALLFFHWLSEADAQLAVVLVQEARRSGDDFGVILIERMRVLERQHLLSRVFSPERLALVVEVLTEAGLAGDEDRY